MQTPWSVCDRHVGFEVDGSYFVTFFLGFYRYFFISCLLLKMTLEAASFSVSRDSQRNLIYVFLVELDIKRGMTLGEAW